MASETTEFNEIYQQEHNNFHDYSSVGDKHEILNLNEYFASVFANILFNTQQTQREVPRSYEYVSRYIPN